METLYNKTLALLDDQRGNWPKICKDTGLGYQWLTKMSQGKIKDPGVKRIQMLHDYLETNSSNQ